jgi:putative PIG3 family NAD(P)H quinone oxidoreductase
MKAIEIPEPGGPDVLKIGRYNVPTPEEGEVLIKIEAAGVNRPDVAQRQGHYAPPPGAVDIPGLEVAGKIVALGKGVTEWDLGDAICALVTGGGYAEYVTAPSSLCLPIPQGLDMTEAAAIPETFFTVWTNVFDRGRLIAGETFLVHGGSSGIGTTAIQLAANFGARVFATAGSTKKCQACEELGAERAINYKTEDFVEIFKELTDGNGIDVILDMVAGNYVPLDIELAAADGRIILISVLGGISGEIDFLQLIIKRLILTGSTLRPRSIKDKRKIARSLKEKVWPFIESGKIKPQIYKIFPLSDVTKAHQLMESSQHIGKIVLKI